MAITAIDEYFQPAGQQRALAVYASFASGAAWSVPLKLDLYSATRAAFDASTPDADAFFAFEKIYNNLAGYWQIFRPYGAAKSWSARRVFNTIRDGFTNFGWSGPVNLPNFHSSGQRASLMVSLLKLEGIKPTQTYPVMTVSKFLHFFNPGLFPIYDTEVICNIVFKQFKSDFAKACSANNLDAKADGAAFLSNYMCWGSSVLSSAHPNFMASFVTWLEDELPRRQFETLDRDVLKKMYATAFEFVAIGAAVAEEAKE